MNNLSVLMNGAFGRKVPAEFATSDYDYKGALLEEMKKLAGTPKLFRRNQLDVFDVLAENLDEILPQRVQEAVGIFCDVVSVPQGTRLQFRVRKGKNRAKQFVTRATESGYYETFRLDRESFDVYPVTYGGAGIVDFERYLDGAEDIVDIYEVITDGLVDAIYAQIQECLLSSWNAAGRPAANKVSATAFDPVSMRALVRTVAAYGSPVIYCAPEFAAEMFNVIAYNTEMKFSDTDIEEIRERGYIGKFYGAPVIVMPQSYTDDSNTKTTMNPCFAYVIPAGKEKIVKVGMEGESFFKEFDNRDNSIVIQAYKKIGVAMVNTPNYWGIYYNAGISAGGWEDYNTALVG